MLKRYQKTTCEACGNLEGTPFYELNWILKQEENKRLPKLQSWLARMVTNDYDCSGWGVPLYNVHNKEELLKAINYYYLFSEYLKKIKDDSNQVKELIRQTIESNDLKIKSLSKYLKNI